MATPTKLTYYGGDIAPSAKHALKYLEATNLPILVYGTTIPYGTLYLDSYLPEEAKEVVLWHPLAMHFQLAARDVSGSWRYYPFWLPFDSYFHRYPTPSLLREQLHIMYSEYAKRYNGESKELIPSDLRKQPTAKEKLSSTSLARLADTRKPLRPPKASLSSPFLNKTSSTPAASVLLAPVSRSAGFFSDQQIYSGQAKIRKQLF